MKERIGIDARMCRHAGIGRYVSELGRALLRIAPADRFVFWGSEAELRPVLGADATIEPARSPIYSAAEQWELARLSRRMKFWHAPHFNVSFFSDKPFVVTIHDLIYLQDPASLKNPMKRFAARALIRHAVRRSSAILTVSEATKQDLLEFFPGLAASKVVVTYEAAAAAFRPVPNHPARSEWIKSKGIQKPFVLYVGSLKPHKNVSTLIRAVERLRSQSGLDVQAVLVGRADPKHPEILNEIHSAPDAVRYLGPLPDEALVDLYNAAQALVLPSFREGFGLPVLEAMACGTPVILSRRASLPEIAGEAGLYFEPDRVDGLEGLLYTVFSEKDLRQKMSPALLARASRYNWERTARQTLAVYEGAGR